jgi:serine/threonine-protein kinase
VIGRVIDKYRIVEEVGQGGMSVVYKGMDTSLNREVAVKVLHPHLASSDEARKRFEREAHAVAKLRHENILEIYDYSGLESPDSYIVTELIRGRTLRAFIGEHPLAYPEIAAMIVVETCRALSHAHALGVLHRDVKPENIMIREDGVLKLMDFGIAQIVDSQRMTVTGQLLGSPAYMSPEHVEGRPLDFRTDVFSVGILLYQLATGELPFKGRNPHEILKRIADCKYLDARVVNPLVADRLNRIIMRALARMPDDRYSDVSIMLDDLERFVAEVDLTDPRSELKRFFANPMSYEQALRQRLVAALVRGGRDELAGRRTARAIERWNRVLTIDPSNEEVLRLIDGLSRRRRLAMAATIGAALLVAGGGGVWVWRELNEPALPLAGPTPSAMATPVPALTSDAPDGSGALVSTAADAGPELVVVTPPPPEPTRPPPPKKPERDPTAITPVHPDNPIRPVGGTRTFRIVPKPANAFFSLDGGPFEQVSMGAAELDVGPGVHRVTFRHPLCDDEVVNISASDSGGVKPPVRLPWKNAQVRVRCEHASALTVDGRPTDNGSLLDILDFKDNGKHEVKLEYTVGDGPVVHETHPVTAGESREVTCGGG